LKSGAVGLAECRVSSKRCWFILHSAWHKTSSSSADSKMINWGS